MDDKLTKFFIPLTVSPFLPPSSCLLSLLLFLCMLHSLCDTVSLL